nr:hypothetical protein [Tanacetum cinerariifolium]
MGYTYSYMRRIIQRVVMVIDKSWTLLEHHEKAFYTGLTKFVDDCKPLVNSVGNVKCSCKSCRTVLWVSIKNLPKHITRYGWDPGYKTWVHHGEPDLPSPPAVIDNTREPQMSDMIALLNDLSYICPNNEQNKPTQGDIGETSNEPTLAKRNEFEELYASANEELYLGCVYVTRLDFMAKFTYFKVKVKLTDSIFNEMLEFFQHVFPTMKGYKLPPSYYAIKKTFKTIGLGYESIHACVNDCFLFRGDNNKDVHFYLVCKTGRWNDNNAPGKKVPKKVLRYFLIIPRLQHLYKSSDTAKEMIWNATRKCTEPSKMQYPVDSRAWKNFDTKYPNFAKEPINVQLGLATDGFNPFESSFMLTLLIFGPKSPGKDIDVYLRPLIDDLMVLWALKGVETIDIATCQKHRQGKTRLKKVGHSKWLVAWQTKNGKCLKPQAAYSFTPKNGKEFCQFIKGVKLPDRFGSNFKHKVIDNDTNITGLKSHDCHIMMQRLLPYVLQQYLPDEVTKLIIKLCSFFKQICSANLMEDDMLKAQSKVVDILCNLELIYFLLLSLTMTHLGIHLPLEAIEAKQECSITEGYAAEEALTFSSYYFWDVTTKFNHLDRNVDPPPPTCQFQIRQSHVDNDPSVSATSKLFALACGPTPTPISVNSCVVNGVSNEGRKVKHLILRNNMTQILTKGELFKDDQYILKTQVKQCFYLEDMDRRQPYWKVIEHVNHKKFSYGGGIVVKEDPDVIHFDNSSVLPLFTSLNDLDDATLHVDGQSTEVDTPPDIIDLDEDDDIIDDEDALPHDLADSDDEDLVDVDDDDGVDETQNLGLKKITDDKGLVPIRFEWDDKKTLMPFGDHASQWSNYLGELIREMPLYYPSWQKVPAERKAAIVTNIEFDLKPHMQSHRWTYINAGIQQRLQKLYNTNKASLKAAHWVINPETGTYDVESIGQRRPENITLADWDAQIAFWNDPRNQARAAQNHQNRAKSMVVCRQRSRLLARLRDQMSSVTREYPSLIHTFFVTHTVSGIFTRDEDRVIYEEMLRLQALGSNTPSGVPYTEEEINALARKGKQREHILGVGRVLPGRATDVLSPPPPQCTHNSIDVEKLKKKNKYPTKQDDEMADDEDGGEDEEDEEDGDS